MNHTPATHQLQLRVFGGTASRENAQAENVRTNLSMMKMMMMKMMMNKIDFKQICVKNLVQSTVGIEVCVSKWFKEAHMVGVGVDDVNVVGVLWCDHQLGVVAKPLRRPYYSKTPFPLSAQQHCN